MDGIQSHRIEIQQTGHFSAVVINHNHMIIFPVLPVSFLQGKPAGKLVGSEMSQAGRQVTAARWGRYTRGAMQIRADVREVPHGLMVHKDMKGFIRGRKGG